MDGNQRIFLKCTYEANKNKTPIIEIKFYSMTSNKDLNSIKIVENDIEPVNINVYPECKSAVIKKSKPLISRKMTTEFVGNFDLFKEFKKKSNLVICEIEV